ncbi:MAG: hypothetical protein ACTS10_21780 [Kiloniellales bacterium]
MAALKAHFALKALVIGLGMVILVMLAAVVFGILRQADQLQGSSESAFDPVADRGGGFAETEIVVPVGCSLAEVVPDRDLLVLRLDGPAERGCQQVVIVDPAGGAVLGRVRLRPEG